MPPSFSDDRHGPPESVSQDLESELNLTGVFVFRPQGHQIYDAGAPVEHIYKVVSGAVRACRFLTDGRRQISAFYLPGEFFGIEFAKRHSFATEVIEDVTLLVIKRSLIEMLNTADRQVTQAAWKLAGQELRRAQNLSLLLKRTASERVAAFLLEMAEQLHSAETIELPMSRQDIADYLGLTIETISRTLTNLETKSAITLLDRKRLVLNFAVLRRLVV